MKEAQQSLSDPQENKSVKENYSEKMDTTSQLEIEYINECKTSLFTRNISETIELILGELKFGKKKWEKEEKHKRCCAL
jgi:hypothetical protein